MFTGLIREMAYVKSFNGSILSLKAEYKPKLGDSIAINGACLSVISIQNDGFSVELSHESQKHLALENYKDEVHIEPAMMMGDRFEGHIVQGHIDTIGKIRSIKKNSSGSYDFFITCKDEFIKYIVPKGSITIDGVSLTVNDVFGDGFRLTIIPITMRETLFKGYKQGSLVNIETDMFARYVDNILKHQSSSKLTWDRVDFMHSMY
jgi:riboflavin synthase